MRSELGGSQSFSLFWELTRLPILLIGDQKIDGVHIFFLNSWGDIIG
jgi:hypothetical protein